ncbi:amidohydrolase family protein [Geobacter sp. FeAm09]|uniref:amidohydrolase family protein n=1 Tax=Geobacter sp. FeAm09 TaxID=2597769 RepID=UPI0011EF7764|nr:amidohydrolase family protein [Geobacter sp. FeAm09]QEM67072.1 amidohydrolase family protein [Geobacter sp. FeAm09]
MSESTIYAASWLINPAAPPLAGGALLVRRGTVAAVGTLAELRSAHAVPVVEFPDSAIIPGFVNAHTHLELTHFSSWRLRTHVEYNPRRFVDWIIQLIKIRRGLKDEDILASLREGVRMCLESGTTAVGEIVTNPALAPRYQASPLGGRLFFELLGHDPDRFRGTLEAALAACEQGGERLAAGLSPHSPYTIGEGNLEQIRAAASSRTLPLAIHVSESREEADFVFDTAGPLAEQFYPFVGWQGLLMPPRRCSSTELLDRFGLLTPSTLAVHCVHVTPSDGEILKERGCSIVLCPRSNERLDVGTAPLHLFRKLGIPLALGTDSLASNDSLSLWEEMRFALDLFRHDLSVAEAFRMATSGGAAALGLATLCGSLEPGKRADFQVVENGGTAAERVLERVVCEGTVQEVYAGGERYAGGISG